MTKEEIKNIILRNSGLITVEEGEFLFELAQRCQGDILEIGSYLGGSTIILAKRLKAPYKIFAIDPHRLNDLTIKTIGKHIVPEDTSKTFLENIKKEGVKDKIIYIRKTSEEAVKNWNKKFSLLWIDGDHEYFSAKKDFCLWEPHLIKGGAIAFHDSVYNEEITKKILPSLGTPFAFLEGPQKVVKEYLYDSKRFKEIKSVDTITYAIKAKNANFIEKLKNKITVYKINNFNNPNGPVFSKIKSILSAKQAIACFADKYVSKLINSIKSIFPKIDRRIGLLGIFLKKESPKTYYFLKKIKNSIFKN